MLSVFAGGLVPRPAWAQAEAAIRRLSIDDWCKAESTRDLEAKMALFSADAVLMPPGGQTVVGRQAIRAWHETSWKGNKYQCTGTVTEVQVLGDWGYSRGTFSGTLMPASGAAPTRDSGKFFNVVRRQTDGTWKLARIMWNAN
jgi:uncharacterized protein (TIGR02246 family)